MLDCKLAEHLKEQAESAINGAPCFSDQDLVNLIKDMLNRICELENRLEMDPDIPLTYNDCGDGIACRNKTISLLDKDIDTINAGLEKLGLSRLGSNDTRLDDADEITDVMTFRERVVAELAATRVVIELRKEY